MTLAIETSRLQETARTLGRVTQLWLDPSPFREEAITALQVSTGFSRSLIENALASAFEELTEEKILNYAASEPGFQSGAVPEKVLHILAGNVFTSWLPGAVTTLLLGAGCDLKPSTREQVFAPLWKRSINSIDPQLADKIQIVSWQESLPQRYPAVVAYGSDESLAAIRATLRPDTRFVGYGHKLSVALLWKDALAAESMSSLLDRLESDAAPFQLQGCLSPQVVYMEGGDPGIFKALGSRLTVMPTLKRFDSWEGLKTDLETYKPFLSALGYAGSEGRIEELRSEWEALGFSRVCRVGEMQRPPLAWRNGGFSLVDALTRA